MQHGIHETNSNRMVRQATVCVIVIVFAVSIVRFGMGDSYDVNSSGFKIENTSSPLRKGEDLPWVKKD